MQKNFSVLSTIDNGQLFDVDPRPFSKTYSNYLIDQSKKWLKYQNHWQ